MGTIQNLGATPLGVNEGRAADGTLSSDVQIPIYRLRKANTEAQMFTSHARTVPVMPDLEDTTGAARILRNLP